MFESYFVYKVFIFIMILELRYINLSDKEKEQKFQTEFSLASNLPGFILSRRREVKGGRGLGYINATVNIIPLPPKEKKI